MAENYSYSCFGCNKPFRTQRGLHVHKARCSAVYEELSASLRSYQAHRMNRGRGDGSGTQASCRSEASPPQPLSGESSAPVTSVDKSEDGMEESDEESEDTTEGEGNQDDSHDDEDGGDSEDDDYGDVRAWHRIMEGYSEDEDSEDSESDGSDEEDPDRIIPDDGEELDDDILAREGYGAL